MLPQITAIYDRRHTASPDKKAPVELRVTYEYQQRYINTGIKLYPHQWKNGKITDCPDIIQLSQMLDKLLQDIRQTIYDMMEEGIIDISTIPDRLERKKQEGISFMDFCHQRAEIRKYGKSEDTQKRYNRFVRLFITWGKIKEFRDITDASIISYDKYLTNKGMKPYSKWNNYHRFLNSFILDAIDEGYLKRNPYKWINIDKQKNSKSLERCLTPNEFSRLKIAKMPTQSLERVRDLFVFQTYTCLSYTDLRTFNPRNVQEIKGTNVYLGSRNKTSIGFTIPLLTPALEILHKYEGKLPVISNVKYNEYLKLVAQASGIDRPISSHWARHTGATMLLNEGIDMKIVAKICGHSSIRITEQIYAKLLDETVVDAISDLDI